MALTHQDQPQTCRAVDRLAFAAILGRVQHLLHWLFFSSRHVGYRVPHLSCLVEGIFLASKSLDRVRN